MIHDAQAPRPQQATSPIRVLIVEDHPGVREGIIRRLEAEANIEVIAAVGTVGEAITSAEALKPDVAVLDVELPDGNGIALCQRMRTISPTTRNILYTSVWIGPETADRAGAAAIVLKQLVGDRLLDSIHNVTADL